MVLLPYGLTGKILSLEPRKERGFGSSDQVNWSHMIKQWHPELELKLNGKSFQGVIETGADVSVIALRHWPKSWSLKMASADLQSVGQVSLPQQSARQLQWEDPKGNTGLVKPYVLDHLPVNLWGRDVLAEMGVLLFSPNSVVTSQMFNPGLNPTKELGKMQQGRLFPIPASHQQGQIRLGHNDSLPFH